MIRNILLGRKSSRYGMWWRLGLLAAAYFARRRQMSHRNLDAGKADKAA